MRAELLQKPRPSSHLVLAAGTSVILFLASCDSTGPELPQSHVVTYDDPFVETIVREEFDSDLPVEPGVKELEMEGLLVSSTLDVRQEPSSGTYMWADIEVRITNGTASSVTMPGVHCALTVQAFSHPDRTGEPVGVADVNHEWCRSPINPNSEVTLQPGESEAFFSSAPLFGQDDGRYYLTALLNTGTDTLSFPAGSIDWYWTPPNLAYHLSLTRERGNPDTLEATLSIENVGSDPVYLEWPHWSFDVYAYPNSERSGMPVFKWLPTDIGCRDILNSGLPHCAVAVEVAPGERYQHPDLRARFGVDEVLTDSLESGLYHFTIQFKQNSINERTFLFAVGVVEIGE